METKKLYEIIKDLTTLRGELSLDISDDVLFENGIKVFISDNIQNQKSQAVCRTSHSVGELSSSGEKVGVIKDSSSPTEKQLYFLAKYGIKIPRGLTKLEASKIIEEVKSKW